MSGGSDKMCFEEEPAVGGAASFAPPITPSVSGSPGPNKTLQTDGAGTVGWYTTVASIPDPGGNGYIKEGPPGTFTNIPSIPNTDLANSSVTINTSGLLAGGGPLALGGTLNLSATLPSVGPGASSLRELQSATIDAQGRITAWTGLDSEVFTVGPVGSGAPYNLISAAITAATAVLRTPSNPALIRVLPGEYDESASAPYVDLYPHVYVVAAQPSGARTFVCQIRGAGFRANFALQGAGKLTTYTVLQGVGVRNAPANAIYFTGSTSQQLWLFDVVCQGSGDQLVLDNTFTVGTDGASQVTAYGCEFTALLFSGSPVVHKTGWYYSEDNKWINRTVSGGFSGPGLKLTPTGTSAFNSTHKLAEVFGQVQIDATGSTLAAANAYMAFGFSQFSCVTGTPTSGPFITVKNSGTLSGILTLTSCGFLPYANLTTPGFWSSAALAPIRGGAGSVAPTPVYAVNTTWLAIGASQPRASLCDNTATGAAGQVGTSNAVIIDPNGITAGTYTSPASVTVGPDGKLTAITAGATLPASTVLVFRPGGVAAPGVYTTWASLMTAFSATVGLVTVVFDNSAGSLVIPSGGPYDFAYRADWVSLNVSGITIQNTTGVATVKNVRRIIGRLAIDTDSATFPPMSWDRIGGLSEPRVWISQDVTLQATLGTVSLIQVPSTSSLTIYADLVSTIGPSGGGTNSAIKLSAAPCTFIADLRGGSSLNKNAINSPVGTTVQVNWGANENFDTTQANVLGTLNYQESSEKLYKADEDFLAALPGAYSWQTVPANGAGSATASAPASADATSPGVWSSSTGTTAGGRSFAFLGATGNLGDIAFSSTTNAQFCEWLVRIPAISQVGETFFCVFGWGDNPTAGSSGNYAVAFRIETSNLITCLVRTAAADTALTLATATAFPENVWRRLRISHDGTTCKFEWGLGRTGQLTTLHTFAMSSPLLAPFATNRMGLIAKIQKSTGINPRTIEYDRARFR